MFKKIITVITLIIISGIGYWAYQSTIQANLTEAEQYCIDSGGTISTSLCCKSATDFPNLCLIGACGCSPENSHQVKVCDCGIDKCFDGEKCVSLNEISNLLEKLQQETGIAFSEIGEVEFDWVVEIAPETKEVVVGKGFWIEGISGEQFDNVYSFFEDRGFKVDVYNVASGTVSGLRGYKKEKDTCLIIGGLSGYKEAEGQWIPPEPDKWDIVVNCGQLR